MTGKKTQNIKSNKNNFLSFQWVSSAMCLTLITGILYLIGIVYYNGLVSGYQLNTKMVSRDFHDLIYQGFWALYSPVFLTLFFIAIAAIYYLLLQDMGKQLIIKYARKGYRQKKLVTKYRKFFYGSLQSRKNPDPNSLNDKLIIVVKLLLSITVFWGAVTIGLLYFENKGETTAKLLLKEYLAEENKNNRPNITVKIDGRKTELVLLTCGSRNCAAINADSKEVHYFPQSIGYSFIYSAQQ